MIYRLLLVFFLLEIWAKTVNHPINGWHYLMVFVMVLVSGLEKK